MKQWLFRRFSRKLTFALCLPVILGMGATGILLTQAMREHLVHELTLSLYSQADLIASRATASMFTQKDSRRLHALAHELNAACGCRITFINPDGIVLGDSDLTFDQLAHVENHKTRPEVQAVLGGHKENAIRHSHTVNHDLLYAAVPFLDRNLVVGVVRVALPLTQVQRKIIEIRDTISWITLWMMLVVILVALWLSRSIGNPVRAMSRVAGLLAQGDYDTRVKSLGGDELGHLGETLNLLAERVQSTIQDLAQEKTQLATILSNMVEAVIAVDANGRILVTNPALCKLFAVDMQASHGKFFLEVFRHGQLNELIRTVLKTSQSRVDEVRVFTPEEHIFEAHAVPLAEDGRGVGVLLVLHDITRIRRLEQVRKDFVANVSHELRTPLASIKGFAETLRSGALEDQDHRLEFVEDIEGQADRMAKLVEDLLELSAVESGKRAPVLESIDILAIARDVANSLKPLTKRKSVSIEIAQADGPVRVMADKAQIKQVFTNLIDNAIKFNKEKGSIIISAEASDRMVKVSVRDTGSGIPSDDVPRLFERFYRVDKARSRDMGGTGLGLSIVKHIVEAHGGTVDVESAEGQGSTFYFTLHRASS